MTAGTGGSGRPTTTRTNHHFISISKSCHQPTSPFLLRIRFPPKIVLFHQRPPSTTTKTTCCWRRLLPSLLVQAIIPRGSITITSSSSSSYVNAGDIRRIFTTAAMVKAKEDLFDSLPSNRLQCKRCVTAVLHRRCRRRRNRKLNVDSSTNTNNRKKSDALNSSIVVVVSPILLVSHVKAMAQVLFAY